MCFLFNIHYIYFKSSCFCTILLFRRLHKRKEFCSPGGVWVLRRGRGQGAATSMKMKREPAEAQSGYLCHTVFLSTLLGTDILPSRGYTKPRGHTDIWLHNQRQTGLGRTLSTEEDFNGRTGQCCGAALAVLLTSLAAVSHPAGAAAAPSGPPVALAAVFTVAPLLAVRPKPAHITICKTRAGQEV